MFLRRRKEPINGWQNNWAKTQPLSQNGVLIQHNQDFVSVYKHCGSLLKREGDAVKGGEAIALVGNTGELSTGPHLHFELWHKGRAVNPELYIVF